MSDPCPIAVTNPQPNTPEDLAWLASEQRRLERAGCETHIRRDRRGWVLYRGKARDERQVHCPNHKCGSVFLTRVRPEGRARCPRCGTEWETKPAPYRKEVRDVCQP